MKIRIPVTSYIIVKAESIGDAINKFETTQSALKHGHRLPSDEEKEMFLNAEITEGVEEEVDDFTGTDNEDR